MDSPPIIGSVPSSPPEYSKSIWMVPVLNVLFDISNSISNSVARSSSESTPSMLLRASSTTSSPFTSMLIRNWTSSTSPCVAFAQILNIYVPGAMLPSVCN